MLYLLGFLYLDFAGRAQFLQAHGRRLVSRNEGEYEVQLYWTQNFFAEVYFSQTRNRMEKISAVTRQPDFEAYLTPLNLNPLLRSRPE
ncbi:hypothetical protein EFA69_00220 [Rufibacter immobilis]|uniref:Uncharacterized protein n=1 Tax=Rufibacter immobilis TaxID=1348778 RepID=A0A3M9N573_9BACT|nr:hypothetical protein [Rufibacter immobilis]RNI32886.1 hypothetical protein EFA69_00220 [Rufibacter immobilis]